MSDRDRVCQRAGCQRPAAVTLSFRYDARQASLSDLIADKHPAHYDLCGAHADVLRVPRGWERLDRRIPRPEPEIEAFVRSIDQVAPQPPPQPWAEPPPRPQPSRPQPQPAAGARRFDRYAALTADLPRLAAACARAAAERADDERAAIASPFEPVTAPALPEDHVLDGQLQMSIEPESDGVVVALTRSRQP